MHFLLHGSIDEGIGAALATHKHKSHGVAELLGAGEDAGEMPAGLLENPAGLLPLLEKRQWNLLTGDAQFVRTLYEQKLEFPGVVVLVLPEDGKAAVGDDAMTRLFERYTRLTARRLYTVTPSRVKIRQLPGGHA